MKYASWDEFMAVSATQAILQPIIHFVHAERATGEVYPPVGCTFAFAKTPLRDVKVVILGQDPFHGPGQAHGLAFSVQRGVPLPPSLKNVIFELRQDIGNSALGSVRRCQVIDDEHFAVENGDLTPWTQQGVLLLNTALTVRQGEPGSHLRVWQPFTDEIVRAVVDSADVAPHFILWGAKARATFERCVGPLNKIRIITPLGQDPGLAYFVAHSRTITATYSPHPSPLSADRGFFGSRPFSRANLALQLNNPDVTAVDWRLP